MRIVNARLRLDEEGVPRVVKSPAKLYPEIQYFGNAQDIVKVMTDVFEIHKETQEVLYLIALNLKSKPLAFFEIGRGNIQETIVDARGIMIRLMMCNASSFILVHNHPSGDCTPSKPDMMVAERMKQLSDLMGVYFLENLIIGADKSCFSFFINVWDKENNNDKNKDHVEA